MYSNRLTLALTSSFMGAYIGDVVYVSMRVKASTRVRVHTVMHWVVSTSNCTRFGMHNGKHIWFRCTKAIETVTLRRNCLRLLHTNHQTYYLYIHV